MEFADPGKYYDRVYMSKVFTESKEPEIPKCGELFKSGTGYFYPFGGPVLPEEIEHTYPDYGLYPDFTQDTAYGMLTRGCPRCNHTFCITPQKDGAKSVKVADLSEFWKDQKKIVLLDQNILACKDRMDLLGQLRDSKAEVEFNGGVDARFLNDQIIEVLRQIKVKDYHFAWDDPREQLGDKFRQIKESGIKSPNDIGVYVLTNFWSTIEEDLYRVYTLRSMGFMPFVMIYDKQKYVDSRGHWLPDVQDRFTADQLRHFKTCQHMQRWLGNRAIIKCCPKFEDYDRYKNWLRSGKPVPVRESSRQMNLFEDKLIYSMDP